MKPRILALDVATKCGWAVTPEASGVWDLSVKRDQSTGYRLMKFRKRIAYTCRVFDIDLVVFEAARHAAPRMQGALVVQAELQAVVKLYCEQKEIEYRGYSPAEIKKYATGKGNSPKDLVMECAQEFFESINIIDDNHADALWLLELARHELKSSNED